MGLIVLWLICGGIAALIASSKGGSGGLGFVVGVLLGPFGIIAALFMGSDAAKANKEVALGEKKVCPMCAETVLPAAKVCKHCSHVFDETPQIAHDAG